ncbi:MAG: ABC transporter ATP-binding protein, partial [Rectinema sp.]|nr:ABC transporter ATP-binding protein [Rectinema sp.]
RDTSMVFQSYAIFPHMSVGQNVGFGLELKGRPRSEIDREVTHIMEVMGIADLARRRPDQLSGGQQQRVALARAIVNRPSVLLFDEPLSNLDAKLREQMRVEIRRIQQTFGITSVYVTHDQAEAMTVSDRIVVMNKGRMMQIGTPFEIYSRPENRFVADFIGRVNLFPVTVRSLSEGHCVAVGAAGQMLEAYSHAAGVKEGAHALLMVRPESLEIMAADKPIDMKSLVGEVAAFIRDTAEGERRFLLAKGTISKVVYLGATVEYEIEAGFDKPIQAVSHDPVDAGFWKTGDTVQLEYRPTAAHLLPLEE